MGMCEVKKAKKVYYECKIIIENSSVIRQKGESQNGGYTKTKHWIFQKTIIFYPLIHKYVCISGGKKFFFIGIPKFLFIRFEIRPFALLLTNCSAFKVDQWLVTKVDFKTN